jgi:hypothetical protein
MKLPFIFGRNRDTKGPKGDLPEGKVVDGAAECAVTDSGDTFIRGLSDLYCPEGPGESHLQGIADVLLETGRITPQQY